MPTIEIFLLRLIHIVGGTFWVGSALFTSLFLVPALATSGANASQVFAALRERRLFTLLPLVAVLTIASGLRLMWITSVGFAPSYFASAAGRVFASSGTAAIVAFLLSLLVARPASARSAQLGASLASLPEDKRARLAVELTRLRRRGAVASGTAVTLLVLGAAGMAVARYL
jgi:uncharacterized membrane protein